MAQEVQTMKSVEETVGELTDFVVDTAKGVLLNNTKMDRIIAQQAELLGAYEKLDKSQKQADEALENLVKQSAEKLDKDLTMHIMKLSQSNASDTKSIMTSLGQKSDESLRKASELKQMTKDLNVSNTDLMKTLNTTVLEQLEQAQNTMLMRNDEIEKTQTTMMSKHDEENQLMIKKQNRLLVASLIGSWVAVVLAAVIVSLYLM